MTLVRFDDLDYGLALYAKGDESALREIFDRYMGSCRGCMYFKVIEVLPEGVDLTDKLEVNDGNLDRAYNIFRRGKTGKFFVETNGVAEDDDDD